MKSAEYTIERMTMSEHSDTSWEALFGCEDEDRRGYKLMCNGHTIETELTFREAHEEKAYYEAEDAYALEEDERLREHPESFIEF